MVAVNELYPEEPTASKAKASTIDDVDPYVAKRAAATTAGTKDAAAFDASTAGYSAKQIDVTDPMTAAGQMNSITSTDSANMRRAAQQGMLEAGRRGLQNSSFAAGAAQGAMVDRATPLALQDAQTNFMAERANQDALNRQREVVSGRETDTSRFNAEQKTRVDMANAAAYNEAEKLNASLATAVSQGNAVEANKIKTRLAELQTEIDKNNALLETETSRFNASEQNDMKAQVLDAVATLNEQFMRGEQAIDLAEVQGKYQMLISSNETAARLYDSYFNSIGNALANPDIEPSRVAQYINVQSSMLEAGLRMMDSMNNLDLGTFELPGASGSLTPTPGSGEAVTGEPAPAPGTTPTYPTYPGFPTYPYPV